MPAKTARGGVSTGRSEPDDDEMDTFLHAHAPCALRLGIREGGIWKLPGGRLVLGSEPPPRARQVGRFAVVSSSDQSPIGSTPPPSGHHCYVIEPHCIQRLAPRPARLVGLMCQDLRRSADAAVLAAWPELMRLTHEQSSELAGVVTYQRSQGTCHLRRWEGPSQAHAVDPHCGGRRAGDRRRPDDNDPVVAEFHTHPTPTTALRGLPPERRPHGPVPRESPPSYQDVYQLLLSAAKGEHNRCYVLACEGVWVCTVPPDVYRRTQDNLMRYLAASGYDDREAREVVDRCDQPTLSVLAARREHAPVLYDLLTGLRDAYQQMVGNRVGTRSADRVAWFCEQAGRLGLDVSFLPAPPSS